MKFKITLAFFIAFTLLYSCKKNDTKKDEDTQQTTKISGKIKFPTASNLSPSGCSVNSYLTYQTLSDENYTVDIVSNEFNIQFLTSSGGKELMLGYTYPSQTDFTIDSKSTLLGLVMKLPAVNSLSTSGKLNFINKIKDSPGYTDAINAIETHIISGQDIFDTTDVNMQQKIASLFDYAATHRQGFGYDGQVYINKNGKTLTFGNPGVSIAQVIGIYQGNNRIAKLELDRYKSFVTSITQIPSAINNPPSLIEVPYNFQNDGVYQIKVRSGGFNLPNNDLESNEALVSNALNFVLDNLKEFIPIDLSKKCPQAIYDATKSLAEVYKSAMRSSADVSAFLGIGYNLTKAVIHSIIINNICIADNAGQISYLEKISKYLKWIDFVGKVGTTLNNSIFIVDYFFATNSSLDTSIAIGTIVPALTTGNVSSVTQNSAVSGGDIINDGGSPITARGVCWSTSSNPTVANSKTIDGSGSGSFISNINSLTANTTYFVRAYATNTIGTAYGNEVSFQTTANTIIRLGTLSYNGGGTNTLNLSLNINNGVITGTLIGAAPTATAEVNGTINGSQMNLTIHTNNNYTTCSVNANGNAQYNIDEKWTITGSTDSNLSFYNATFQYHKVSGSIIQSNPCVAGPDNVSDATGTFGW